jgi:hypothetical protein
MEATAAPSISSVIALLSAHGSTLWLLVAYVALFGVRIGPKDAPWFQVHGIVGSLWALAQSVGAGVERLGRIEDKLNKALGIEPRAALPSTPPK